jgi:hypothetical protein
VQAIEEPQETLVGVLLTGGAADQPVPHEGTSLERTVARTCAFRKRVDNLSSATRVRLNTEKMAAAYTPERNGSVAGTNPAGTADRER